MRLTIFLTFLLTFSLSVFSIWPSYCIAEEIINSIELNGNQRLDQGGILSQLDLKIGDKISSAELNQLIKKLHKTGLFSDLSITLANGKLLIKIKENVVINSIIIRGNKFISNSTLKKAVKIKENTNLNISQLESSIKELKNLYKFRGRPNANITYIIEKLPPANGENSANNASSANIIINIKEERALKIAEIKFTNNNIFGDNELKRVILSREFSVLNLFGTSFHFVKEFTELMDKELLRKFYLARGFFDFNINDIKITITKDNWVYINFILYEGSEYKFGNINVNVASSIKTISSEEIKKIISISPGSTFNINSVDDNIEKITNYLNNKGYLFTNIIPTYEEDKLSPEKKINLTFNIKEAKKVYINAINIQGNTRTLDSVIRNELLFSEREPYNLNRIKISRQKLLNLGIFESIEVNERANLSSTQVPSNFLDIDLNIKEKNTGFINLSGGYNSDTGLFANMSLTENNLFGTGNQLSLSLMRSFRNFEGAFGFSKAHLFDTNITGGIALFLENADKKEESSYKITDKGFKLSASYNITPYLSNLLFYSYKKTNIYDIGENASAAIKEQQGESNISTVGYNLTYNKLNDFISPTRGYIIVLNQGLAGVFTGLNFIRSELKFSYYKSLVESKVILNLRSSSGYIFGYAGSNIKLGQRFFINDMRGFENSGIGPRALAIDSNNQTKKHADALGGNKYLFNTIQVEFPLFLPKELEIKGTVFFDNAILTGIDATNEQRRQIEDSGKFRNAIGFGFVWNSPLGKLTLDFGYPITKEPYDKVRTVKFGISRPF